MWETAKRKQFTSNWKASRKEIKHWQNVVNCLKSAPREVSKVSGITEKATCGRVLCEGLIINKRIVWNQSHRSLWTESMQLLLLLAAHNCYCRCHRRHCLWLYLIARSHQSCLDDSTPFSIQNLSPFFSTVFFTSFFCVVFDSNEWNKHMNTDSFDVCERLLCSCVCIQFKNATKIFGTMAMHTHAHAQTHSLSGRRWRILLRVKEQKREKKATERTKWKRKRKHNVRTHISAMKSLHFQYGAVYTISLKSKCIFIVFCLLKQRFRFSLTVAFALVCFSLLLFVQIPSYLVIKRAIFPVRHSYSQFRRSNYGTRRDCVWICFVLPCESSE